ncbi:MAG: hypothetical protein ACRD1N_00565, partial [Terriglobia bacterium]
MPAFVDRTKIHQGPGSLWLGCAVPATGSRLLIDAGGNPVAAGLTAPSAPSLSAVSGGTQPALTCFVMITYINVLGETVTSPEASLAVAANDLLVIQSPAASGSAAGYNVYIGTASGGERLQNSSPVPIGQNWTEAGITANGAPPPATNTAGPLFAGAVSGATTIVWTPKIEALSADQVPAPIDARMTGEEQTIEAEIMETDYAKFRAYMTNGVFSTGSDPG